jgi:predicted Fe-Mo cluster-binding NifX family protein
MVPVGKLFAHRNFMKIAIPEFNGRVSPTLDFCRQLLLVDVTEGELSETTTLDFSEMESSRRIWFLKKLGVDTLLCGGISRDLAEEIRENGIKVIPWVSGEIKEVLQAYIMDKLPDPKLTSPGFHPEQAPERSGEHLFDFPSDICVCPKCGHRITAEKGLPCGKKLCPDCGSMMFRE